MNESRGRGGRGSGTRMAAALGAVGLAVLVLIAVLAVLLLTREPDPFGGEIAEDRFQTAVLSNDRVYFGRLQGRRGDFFLLTDVYFLREEAAADAGGDPIRQVVPLSAEVHGPEDRMLIHESQLVLVENLDEESAVLETIEELEDD